MTGCGDDAEDAPLEIVDMLLRPTEVDSDGVAQRRLDLANFLIVTMLREVQPVMWEARAVGNVKAKEIIQSRDPGGIVNRYAPFPFSYPLQTTAIYDLLSCVPLCRSDFLHFITLDPRDSESVPPYSTS